MQPTFEVHLINSLPQLEFDNKSDFLRWLLTSLFTGEVIPKAAMLTMFNSRYKKLLDNYYKDKCTQLENIYALKYHNTSENRKTSENVENRRDSRKTESENEENVWKTDLENVRKTDSVTPFS